MVKDYEKIIDYIMLLRLTYTQKLALITLVRQYNGKEIDWKTLKKLKNLNGKRKSEIRKIFNAILPELINRGWIRENSESEKNSDKVYLDPNKVYLDPDKVYLDLEGRSKQTLTNVKEGLNRPCEKSSNPNALAKSKVYLDLNKVYLDPAQKLCKVYLDPAENQVKSTVCEKIRSKQTLVKNDHPKIVRVCNNNIDILSSLDNNVILVIKSLFRNINNNINNRDTAKKKKVQIDLPDKKKKRKSEPGRPTYTEDFARFWEYYPRKEAKKLAIKAFEKAKLTTDVNKIIEGAKKYAEFVKKHGIENRYILLAHNWLKQERWNDEYKTDSDKWQRLGKGNYYDKW